MPHGFLSDENGAVTVDWVVLTAALVGLGLAVSTVVRGGIQNLSGDISTVMASYEIETVFQASYPWEQFGIWPLGGSPEEADPGYVPYDQAMYDLLVAEMRNLDPALLEDLDAGMTQASRLAVQSVLASGEELTADNVGRVSDSEAALALVMGERGVDRWTGTGASEADLAVRSERVGADWIIGTGPTTINSTTLGSTGG
ncbi:MAG: hypothetical protein AAGE03_06810 [Pseudomonadota bacterium]